MSGQLDKQGSNEATVVKSPKSWKINNLKRYTVAAIVAAVVILGIVALVLSTHQAKPTVQSKNSTSSSAQAPATTEKGQQQSSSQAGSATSSKASNTTSTSTSTTIKSTSTSANNSTPQSTSDQTVGHPHSVTYQSTL